METTIMTDEKPKRDKRRTNRTNEQLQAIRSAFIEWVQHILDQKGWTPTELANHSEMAPSTILRIMNSQTHPFNISFMTIRKVSDGSGYPIPNSLLEAHGVEQHSMPKEALPVKPRHDRPKARSEPAAPASGAVSFDSAIPLRHISALPSTLAPKVADTQTACPQQMADDETAFAVLMPDDGLMPIVRSGNLLYATKRRDPATGDIVVVIEKSGRGRVRMVEAIDEDGLHLERLHPEKKQEVIGFDDVEEFGVVEGVWRR